MTHLTAYGKSRSVQRAKAEKCHVVETTAWRIADLFRGVKNICLDGPHT